MLKRGFIFYIFSKWANARPALNRAAAQRHKTQDLLVQHGPLPLPRVNDRLLSSQPRGSPIIRIQTQAHTHVPNYTQSLVAVSENRTYTCPNSSDPRSTFVNQTLHTIASFNNQRFHCDLSLWPSHDVTIFTLTHRNRCLSLSLSASA